MLYGLFGALGIVLLLSITRTIHAIWYIRFRKTEGHSIISSGLKKLCQSLLKYVGFER